MIDSSSIYLNIFTTWVQNVFVYIKEDIFNKENLMLLSINF